MVHRKYFKIDCILLFMSDVHMNMKPLNIHEDTPHTHKNSRAAKMQELYEKLSPDKRRIILKQVKTLVGQQ